jgi:hypothetical protein
VSGSSSSSEGLAAAGNCESLSNSGAKRARKDDSSHLA